MTQPVYPFSAVVGQDTFKLALLLTAINPLIGGVLVSGPRGSAKSTLARAMADIMPCDAPFVTLPLGASIEMVTGSIDLEAALKSQSVTFKPGLLANAHQGILYVDEVNLLHDSLVDVLLDVAASGVNYIERDGLSHQHAAKCLLLGTMNPDEGELRPQLLDRFGLSVNLSATYTVAERVDIVQRREAFDTDHHAFLQHYSEQQAALSSGILEARAQLPHITCEVALHETIAARCLAANVDGLRADIVWLRAAKAFAAFQGLHSVTIACVDAVEELVLNHRRQAPDVPPKVQPPSTPPSGFKRPPPRDNHDSSGESNAQSRSDWGAMNSSETQSFGDITQGTIDPKFDEALARWQQSLTTDVSLQSAAQPASVLSESRDGVAKSISTTGLGVRAAENGVDWFQTLRCSSVKESLSLQYKAQTAAKQVAHIVLLDTSASGLSSGYSGLLPAAKQLVVTLAERAYLAREHWVLWGFGGDDTQQIISPRRAPKAIEVILNTIEVGGGTPFKEAIKKLEKALPGLQRQYADCRVYIISDGCTTANLAGIRLAAPTIMIDTEARQPKRGRGKLLAQQLNAHYLALDSRE